MMLSSSSHLRMCTRSSTWLPATASRVQSSCAFPLTVLLARRWSHSSSFSNHVPTHLFDDGGLTVAGVHVWSNGSVINAACSDEQYSTYFRSVVCLSMFALLVQVEKMLRVSFPVLKGTTAESMLTALVATAHRNRSL